MNSAKKYDLEDRLIEFAIKIIELVEELPQSKAGNHIAGQLIRCGTSPALNYGEVQSSESQKDFIMRIRISRKESKESRYWLKLVDIEEEHDQEKERNSLIKEATELILFSSILQKSK